MARVRFRSFDGSSDCSPDGDTRRPSASAVVAVTSVQSAPRVRLDVTAQRRVSLLALPDTGADICVGGLDFLEEMGEYPENLLPAEQHPRAANGETITSVGILPVSLTLGRVTTDELVHILQGVSGLLISWKATRELCIIPDTYPRQINTEAAVTAALSKERPELRRLERDQSQHRNPTRAVHPGVALGRGADTGSVATAQDDSVLRHGTTATRDAVTDVSHCAGPVPPGGDATPATPTSRYSTSLVEVDDASVAMSSRQDSPFPDIPAEFPTVFDGHIRVMPGEEFN